GERSRRADDRQNVRFVLLVRGENGDDQLDVVAEALGEKWSNGTVGQSAGKNCLFRRSSLTLEETARNLTSRVQSLLVVDCEREKIHVGSGLSGGGRGGEDDGVSIAHGHRAVGLSGQLARFDSQHPAADRGLKTMYHRVFSLP